MDLVEVETERQMEGDGWSYEDSDAALLSHAEHCLQQKMQEGRAEGV